MRRPTCLFTAIVALFLFGALPAPPPARGESPVVVKLATLAPEGSSWIQVLKDAAGEAQQKTGNAVQFKIYAGGVMGDERDMVRKMHIGQIQAAMLSSASLASMFPEIDVLQVPFFFNSYPEADFVFPRRQFHFGEGVPQFSTEQTDRFLLPLVLIGTALMAMTVGQWGGHQWQEFLLFDQGRPVGVADPILGKDLGFYFFTLPFIKTLKGFAGFTLVFTTLVTALLYFLRGGISATERGISPAPAVKRHLAVLAGLILVNTGFGFYLVTFQLLHTDRGAVYGAGYTDVHARLPVYRALASRTLPAR